MRQAIQFPQLGCLPRVALLVVLGAWVFWINSPADASERWSPKEGWSEKAADGSLAIYGYAKFTSRGTIAIKTNRDVRFYTATEFRPLGIFPIEGDDILFSPDGSMIATRSPSASGPHAARIYRASDGMLMHQLGEMTDNWIHQMVWSPDNRVLAVRYVTPGNYVYWDSSTGLQIDPPFAQPPEVWDMVYSPDGSTVYLSTQESLVALRVADGHELYRHRLPSSKLTLAPDSTLLIAYERGHIRAFNAADGMPLWELGTDDSDPNRTLRFPTVSAVAFSPDNQYLAVGERHTPGFFFGWVDKGEIALVRMADGTIVRRYRGQEKGIGSLVFTADGQTFLSSNGEEIARWNVETRQPWLMWLPITGIILLLLQGGWQWFQNRRTSP